LRGSTWLVSLSLLAVSGVQIGSAPTVRVARARERRYRYLNRFHTASTRVPSVFSAFT
jgi:hypothetical protein